MEKQIRLSENHRRSLSSSLQVVEKSLTEMKELMQNQNEANCFEILKDVDNNIIENNLKAIQEASMQIQRLAEKYSTAKEKSSLKRIINAKQSKMWEVLTDSQSRKLKGFGAFPKKYAEEYDSDIQELIEIINRINY